MSQATIAQINVRLPRSLKESGDAGLQELGCSPSDAVRALWSHLSEGPEGLERAKSLLFGNTDAGQQRRLDAFEQSALAKGWRLVDEHVTSLGIAALEDVGARKSEISDSELVAVALEERMRDRGLM